MKKKIFAMFMAAALCVGMLSSTALADVEQSGEDMPAEEDLSMPEAGGDTQNSDAQTAEPEEEPNVPGADVNSTGEESGTAEEEDVSEGTPADAESEDAIDGIDVLSAQETVDEDAEKTGSVLTFSGEDYGITVTFGPEAELPEDVGLIVSEYDSQSETFKARYGEASALCDLESEEERFDIRLFRVGLYVTGEDGELTEVEPAAPVQVEITYFGTGEDKEDADEDSDNVNYTVIHFGGETEVIQPEFSEDEEGGHIVFDVSGFSDFMVLAETEETQYVILDIGNINGSWRDDSGSLDRYTGYRPWATITGYNGANYDYYGDGSGTGSMVGYGGFADDWRITAAIPVSCFEDDKLTITLPGDADLPESDWHGDRATFYIYGNEGDDDAVSVLLPKENAYDYKLVGWINIGTGEYYSVKGGSTQATIDAGNENIFYADWEAATYDVGYDDGNTADTVSTDFVTVKMFDYNELFNLYSTKYELSGEYNAEGSRKTTAGDKQEYWTIGDTFHTEPLGSTQLENVGSFVFYDGPDARDEIGMLGFPDNRMDQSNGSDGNASNTSEFQGNRVNISSHLGVTAWDDVFFSDYLFSETADSVLGVDYVGEADRLFKYGTEEDALAVQEGYVGYYYYDSRYNSASYNQSEERFYVYNDPTGVGDNSYPEGFYPYNYYGDSLDDHDGTVNYFFGMTMEVNFYLPNVVGKQNGNTVDGKDMTFNFSGDDDIWIFVDDELVLDMSGIHNKSYGSIDFCSGAVSLETTDTAGNIVYTDENINDISGLASGEHTLRVYYLERGGDASNMIVSFNVAPSWEYESDTVGTVTVDKAWQDEDGNTLEGADTADCPDVTVGLYEVDDAGNESLAEMPASGDGTPLFENPVTLSYDEDASDYGWSYTWELLSPEKVEAGNYVVKEISTSSDYTLVRENDVLSRYGYDCWMIVGETEIETWLQGHEEVDASTGEYPRYEVLLTDAASGDSETVFGQAAYLDTSSGSPVIASSTLSFSRHPEETTIEDSDGFETTTGIYGVVSDTEVSACNPGVIWYLEYAEVPEGDVLDVFHICYEADGTTYYLAVQFDDAAGSVPELVISTVKDQNVEDGYYDEFYCDELGEVRLYNLQYRLVLSSADGSIGVAAIDQNHYEHNNIKLYTRSTLEDTPYYSWTFANRLIGNTNVGTGNPSLAGGSTPNSSGGSTPNPAGESQTGDTNTIGLWITLLAAAAAVIAAAAAVRTRKLRTHE